MKRAFSINIIVIFGLLLILNGCAPLEKVRNVQKDSDYNKQIFDLSIGVLPPGEINYSIATNTSTGRGYTTLEKLAATDKEAVIGNQQIASNVTSAFEEKLRPYKVSVTSGSKVRLVLTLRAMDITCRGNCDYKLWYHAALFDDSVKERQEVWSGEFSSWFPAYLTKNPEFMKEAADGLAIRVTEQLNKSGLLMGTEK